MENELNKMYAGLNRLSGNVVNEAADGRGNAHETLRELAMWLLDCGNVLNVYHWNVRKNVKHELLQEAYELCRDTGDKLAETYIAKTGSDCYPKGKTIGSERKEWLPSDRQILSYLRDILDKMNGAVEKNGKFTEGVKNIFADFDETMTTIIYKYSRFEG